MKDLSDAVPFRSQRCVGKDCGICMKTVKGGDQSLIVTHDMKRISLIFRFVVSLFHMNEESQNGQHTVGFCSVG